MAEVDGEDDSGEEKQSPAHTGDGDDVYFKVEAVKLQAQLNEASSRTSFDSEASHALRLQAANGFRGNSGWIQVGYNNEVRFNCYCTPPTDVFPRGVYLSWFRNSEYNSHQEGRKKRKWVCQRKCSFLQRMGLVAPLPPTKTHSLQPSYCEI
jgi:hypothetical protein